MKSPSSLQLILSSLLFFVCISLKAQKASDFYAIIDAVSEERIEQDIATLAGFGTRHTLSDTLSTKRGIGAARRWIFNEFQSIAKKCDGCIEVSYQKNYEEPDGRRIVKPVWINNVIAIPLALSFAPGESSVKLFGSEIRESISPLMMMKRLGYLLPR